MADKILNNSHVTSDIKSEVESYLLKLAERWSLIMTINLDNTNEKNLEAWNEFELLSKRFVSWMSEMKMKLINIDVEIKHSSVDTLKVCFQDIMVRFSIH